MLPRAEVVLPQSARSRTGSRSSEPQEWQQSLRLANALDRLEAAVVVPKASVEVPAIRDFRSGSEPQRLHSSRSLRASPVAARVGWGTQGVTEVGLFHPRRSPPAFRSPDQLHATSSTSLAPHARSAAPFEEPLVARSEAPPTTPPERWPTTPSALAIEPESQQSENILAGVRTISSMLPNHFSSSNGLIDRVRLDRARAEVQALCQSPPTGHIFHGLVTLERVLTEMTRGRIRTVLGRLRRNTLVQAMELRGGGVQQEVALSVLASERGVGLWRLAAQLFWGRWRRMAQQWAVAAMVRNWLGSIVQKAASRNQKFSLDTDALGKTTAAAKDIGTATTSAASKTGAEFGGSQVQKAERTQGEEQAKIVELEEQVATLKAQVTASSKSAKDAELASAKVVELEVKLGEAVASTAAVQAELDELQMHSTRLSLEYQRNTAKQEQLIENLQVKLDELNAERIENESTATSTVPRVNEPTATNTEPREKASTEPRENAPTATNTEPRENEPTKPRENASTATNTEPREYESTATNTEPREKEPTNPLPGSSDFTTAVLAIQPNQESSELGASSSPSTRSAELSAASSPGTPPLLRFQTDSAPQTAFYSTDGCYEPRFLRTDYELKPAEGQPQTDPQVQQLAELKAELAEMKYLRAEMYPDTETQKQTLDQSQQSPLRRRAEAAARAEGGDTARSGTQSAEVSVLAGPEGGDTSGTESAEVDDLRELLLQTQQARDHEKQLRELTEQLLCEAKTSKEEACQLQRTVVAQLQQQLLDLQDELERQALEQPHRIPETLVRACLTLPCILFHRSSATENLLTFGCSVYKFQVEVGDVMLRGQAGTAAPDEMSEADTQVAVGCHVVSTDRLYCRVPHTIRPNLRQS